MVASQASECLLRQFPGMQHRQDGNIRIAGLRGVPAPIGDSYGRLYQKVSPHFFVSLMYHTGLDDLVNSNTQKRPSSHYHVNYLRCKSPILISVVSLERSCREKQRIQ